MKTLKNPFLLTGYHSKKYFCDRESELSELLDHFNNERNIVLFSWRRIGKTALLNRFQAEIDGKQTETLYVDLLGSRDMETAIRRITQAVYDRFGNTASGISSAFRNLLSKAGVEISFDPNTGLPSFNIGMRGSPDGEKSLHAIGTFLESRKKQSLVILDEFQQVTAFSAGNGEAIFRSWTQAFPQIRFIYSGSNRNMMISMFTEKNRPFYRSTQLMQLGPIALESYNTFIRRHFESSHKRTDDNAVEIMYSWCRRQTYCIQLVCNKVFGMQSNLDTDILQDVFDQVLNQESIVFSGYTRLLSDMQWKVLLAIAKEEPLRTPFAKQFILKYQLGAASSVGTALKMLIKNELVILDEGNYYIHDVLLARWLQRN